MRAIDWAGRRVGQAALGVMFVKLGSDAARSPGPRADLASNLGLSNPELAVRGNGAAMVAGGVALITNKLPRLAALGLVASLVPTTLAGHPFWEKEGAERKAQEIQFYKNLALLGGLLVVATRSTR